MINKSAILAWKFPVMNGIVTENEVIMKWEIPEHPELPTDEEIEIWRLEYEKAAIYFSLPG
ncbi:MAG: hypothetical protein Q8J68_14735 [Methanolobus sp.]|uniref:hypothetical protein n=1 Tax=Methanolobus sp. TaxID=1874737 RepID=UPI002730E4C2|nr:hypothetical protein [Methanolobus sp.]MDP2218531.1 hypothetical protein [Methanolobus sp.]